MATYNGEQFLREQLDSFVAQERQPDELVVCDDGSSDGTLDVLKSFAAKAPFKVEVHRNAKTLGFVQNFAKAMSLCTGDMIFLSDQDDVWFETKISRVVHIANSQPKMAVFINDAQLTYHDLSYTSHTMISSRIDEGLSLDEYLTNGCQTAFRAEILKVILPIPMFVHAHDVWIHQFASAVKVKLIIPEVLQCWRRHADSTCGFPAKKESFFKLFPSRLKLFMSAANPVSCLLDKRNEYREIYDRTEMLCNELVSAEVISNACKELEEKIELIEPRISLLCEKRSKRSRKILFALLTGKYRQFRGVLSAAKDLVAENYNCKAVK